MKSKLSCPLALHRSFIITTNKIKAYVQKFCNLFLKILLTQNPRKSQQKHVCMRNASVQYNILHVYNTSCSRFPRDIANFRDFFTIIILIAPTYFFFMDLDILFF